MFRKVVIYLVVAALVWTPCYVPPAAGQQSAEDQAFYTEVMAGYDGFLKRIESLRSIIDRSKFDLEALLEKLDYDSEKIIDFVRDDIYFEQYQGSLRGAKGTLMSQAGNALDQAVLLAALLKDAGYEARIVEGKLPPSSALRLLREVLPADQERLRAKRSADEKKRLNDLRNLQASLGDAQTPVALSEQPNPPVNIEDSPLYQQAQAIAQDLLETIEKVRKDQQDQLEQRLVDEATDYFWVEYRGGPGSQWTSVHPVAEFLSADAESISTKAMFADSVPERLLHRIKIEVLIDQKEGNELVEKPLMSPWTRPAANLHGEILTFTNVPNTLATLEIPDNAQEAFQKATIFAPVLGGIVPAGGQFFDLEGNTVDQMAANSPAAGLFATLSEKTSNAAGAIAESERKEDFVTLVDQRMRITFVSPDGTTTVVERSIFDRRSARDAAEIGSEFEPTGLEDIAALTESRSLLINCGRIPDDFVLEQILNRARDSRFLFDIMVRKSLRPGEKIAVPTTELAKLKTGWVGTYLLFAMFDAEASSSSMLAYRATPNLLIYHAENPSLGHRVAVDIVRNRRRSLRMVDGRVQVALEDSLARGVWETLTEGLLTDAGGAGLNTPKVFDHARRERIPIRLISPSEPDELDSVQMSEEARVYARRDLSAGYHLIIPTRTPESLARTGWWRIDMRDGSTLGMADTGEGADDTEYAIALLVSVAFVALFATCYLGLKGQPRSAKENYKDVGDCLVYGGAGTSAIIAIVYSAAVAAIFSFVVFIGKGLSLAGGTDRPPKLGAKEGPVELGEGPRQ